MTNNKTMKERFLKYVSIHTTSNPHSTSSPSFKGELDLIDLLEKQVKELGLKNIHKSKYGFLYALLPKNSEGFDTIGLIAHVDTSSEASGKNIKTITHKPYNGLDMF